MSDKDTTLIVTVNVLPNRYSRLDDRASEKEIKVEAPLDILSSTSVSGTTLAYMIDGALHEYRDKLARKLQAEQLEKMQAEQEGEA